MLLDTIFAPGLKEASDLCDGPGYLGSGSWMRHALMPCLLAPPSDHIPALLFSSLVQLMSEVVLGVHPTVHVAYQAQKEVVSL